MWEIDEGDMIRFSCHVGHTYIADLMSLALDENLRRALASAQRALEERILLARKLHREAKNKGHKHLVHTWSAKAQEFEQELAIIRDSIHRMNSIAANKELLFSR